MTTISKDAAKRLANPKCRKCKGRGYSRVEKGLAVACGCLRERELQKSRTVVQDERGRRD